MAQHAPRYFDGNLGLFVYSHTHTLPFLPPVNRYRLLLRFGTALGLGCMLYGAYHLFCTYFPFQLPTQCYSHRHGFLSASSGRLTPLCTDSWQLEYTDAYQEVRFRPYDSFNLHCPLFTRTLRECIN